MRKPGEQRASSHVEALIDQGTREGYSVVVLPSVSALARDAGVSRQTMHNAVKRLLALGTLQRRRGTGLCAPGPSLVQRQPSTRTRPSPRTPAQRCAQAIARDILAGIYRPGAPLPSVKELRSRYLVSYRTVRRAVDALREDHLLSGAGRKPIVTPPATPQATGAVAMVTIGTPEGLPAYFDSRSRDVLHQFETECNRRGIRPVIVTNANDTLCCCLQDRRVSPLEDLLGSGDYLGVCVATMGFFPATLSCFAAAVRRIGLPVAVLRETDADTGIRTDPLTAHFSLAWSSLCGREIGEHLFRRGHRRVAYFLSAVDDSWPVSRLNGVMEAARRYGLDNAVLTLSGDPVSPSLEHRPEPGLSELAAACRSGAEALSLEAQRVLAVLPDVRDGVATALQMARHRAAMQPLFEEALRHTDITAWICMSDSFASYAIDFLHQRGKAVPADISVAGFDDDQSFVLHYGLTSYNFNVPGIVQAMVEHVLNPGYTRARFEGADTIEIPGFVTPRRTTGPAAR